MKPVDLEKPFKLSRDFGMAYILLGAPVLWFAKPWNWELPVYAQVAGLIFLPFAAAIICYCPFLFIETIVRSSSKEKQIALAFFAAAISATLFLTMIWFVYDFASIPSRFASWAVIIANLVFAFLRKRTPRLSSQ